MREEAKLAFRTDASFSSALGTPRQLRHLLGAGDLAWIIYNPYRNPYGAFIETLIDPFKAPKDLGCVNSQSLAPLARTPHKSPRRVPQDRTGPQDKEQPTNQTRS